MGFWDAWSSVKEWGSYLWSNAYVKRTVTGSFHSSYQVLENLFEEISVAPKVLYSAATDPQTRQVARHLLRTTAEDLAPIVVASYANSLIQSHGSTYLSNEQDPSWLSLDTTLTMSLGLVDWSLWFYIQRRKAQLMMRNLVMLLESPNALTANKPSSSMTICTEEACTELRFLKGTIRSLIGFWVTEKIINVLSYIPLIGDKIVILGLTYHRGRYALSLVLPKLCDRHQEEYLNEYAELAFALGVGHALTTEAVTRLIEYVTKIPNVYYKEAIRDALLVMQISVAAHMKLPPPVAKSTLSIRDPVIACRRSVDLGFEIVVAGSKVVLPRLIKKERVPTISMEQIRQGIKLSGKIWFHPWIAKVKYLLLPFSLQSMNYFINDAVVTSNWDGLRNTLIDAIKTVEAKRRSWLIYFAGAMPSASSAAAKAFFGVPEPITGLLLKLMANEEFMLGLGAYREYLEGLHVGAPPPIPVEEDSPSLRGHENVQRLPSHKSTESTERKQQCQIPPEMVIQRDQKRSKLGAQDVIQRRSNAKSVSACDVIEKSGKSKSRFFKTDPTNVIVARNAQGSVEVKESFSTYSS